MARQADAGARRGSKNIMKRSCSVFCRPGSDLLFRVLRQSTIGAGSFHDRVRDGIGCGPPAMTTRPAKSRRYLFRPSGAGGTLRSLRLPGHAARRAVALANSSAVGERSLARPARIRFRSEAEARPRAADRMVESQARGGGRPAPEGPHKEAKQNN